jgi:hypothetical protein
MNQRLRIYLDTSVPNFLFAEDSPDELRIITPLELMDYGI